MEELENEERLDKTSDLFNVLPFMSMFPFDDYDITLEERGKDYSELGVSPLLINIIGETGKDESISFNYYDGDSKVLISISREDIEWIAEESGNIKKLDAVRLLLDSAIESENLVEKSKAIKAGRKFAKELGCDTVMAIDFNEVLSEFLKINETVLTSKMKLSLQKLSEATLNSTEFSERQYKAISAFFNFQLNYSRIILGIVIAAKIY